MCCLLRTEDTVNHRVDLPNRRTYADVFTRILNEKNLNKPKYNPIPDYFFYDLNGGINADLSKKDKLFITAYYGQDRFGFNNANFKASFNWGNTDPTRQARYPSYQRRRSSVDLTLLAAGQTVESVEGYGPTLRVGRTGSEVALAA